MFEPPKKPGCSSVSKSGTNYVESSFGGLCSSPSPAFCLPAHLRAEETMNQLSPSSLSSPPSDFCFDFPPPQPALPNFFAVFFHLSVSSLSALERGRTSLYSFVALPPFHFCFLCLRRPDSPGGLRNHSVILGHNSFLRQLNDILK